MKRLIKAFVIEKPDCVDNFEGTILDCISSDCMSGVFEQLKKHKISTQGIWHLNMFFPTSNINVKVQFDFNATE